MRLGLLRCFSILILSSLSAAVWPAQLPNPPVSSETGRYEVRAQHDPDGIGKFYMGAKSRM